MAVRQNEPMQSSFAVFAGSLALTVIAAAPVLAAPDRSIDCSETAAATLEVAETEFSTSRVIDSGDAIELLGTTFELASRDYAEDDPDASEKPEQALENDSETEPATEATVPADAGSPLYKRQMYRRDI